MNRAPGTGPLSERARWGAAAGADAWAEVLAAIGHGSPFLRDLVERDRGRAERMAATSPEAERDRLVAAQRDLGRRYVDGEIDRAGLGRELRANRSAFALLVAFADLGGVWPLEEVTAALSGFADASVESAVRAALREAAATAKLDAAAIGPDGAGCGLVVLALGKHGAGELNYSSDIDLVVFFDPSAAALAEGAEPARLYNRVAQSVVKWLGERTVDGYVHRVDYRLRPDPGSTPAAVSLPAAYTYYETVGQNWERAAMIKARPVAGDLALGHRFLADLEPFVWRKYFDFAAIADIHAMKRQIHAVRGFGEIAVEGHDIKLGRGGIREVEFFVQTQQLVFGGRRPELRGRRTLDMLAALHAEGWITAEARDELSDAYRFLRTIEHRLQMVRDEQTQRLPASREALSGLARFAGYTDLPAFSADLLAVAGRVQRHYGRLFEDAPALASPRGSLVFTGMEDDPATIETLRGLGFQEPERAAETIRGWHFGRRPAVTSARAREVLTDLVPALLDALGGTGDPDGALARLDAAFGRMPAAIELLTILRRHERLRLLFADLLGTAPRLADEVAARPHVLDAVIDPSFGEPVRSEAAIEADLRAAVGSPAALEEFLDAIRDAARQLQFLTGARLLSGILPPSEAGAAYAAVARGAVRLCLERVRTEFAAEHGRLPGGRIVVLGLGRLGAGDLTAGSDLDLVAVYDFDHERRSSDGRRPLDAAVYFTRLTQRLIGALASHTRRGRLFEVDMRLRPSGTRGPVASQLSGFLAYHAGEAETWEHMALTRARVVAGDADLGREIEGAIRGILARPRDRARLFADVLAMRRRVEREKGFHGDLDLKLAPGGLLDLDFLAQALVLAEAGRHPDLIGTSTADVLRRAAELGGLDAGDTSLLVEAYRVLDDAHHWQRLTVGDVRVREGRTAALLRRFAQQVGLADPGMLAAYLKDLRGPVREIVFRTLGAA